jgi:hypothetical protein
MGLSVSIFSNQGITPITPLPSMELGALFHHVKVLKFGSTATAKQRLTSETRIYAPSESTGVKSGNAWLTTTAVP